MKNTMMSSLPMVHGLRVAVAVLGATLVTSVAQAQTSTVPLVGDESWRFGASVGVLSPRAPIVIANTGGQDTRLGAASSFSVDVQYLYTPTVAVYGNGLIGFTSIARGSTVRAASGPSDQVTMMGGTLGLFLSPKWLGNVVRPTLRVGGGYKGYRFDLADADQQWRPTGDFGVGLRAGTSGPLEVSAEVRYLPSSFDQGKLPLRSVVPQAQRQTDLLFGIGVSVRP